MEKKTLLETYQLPQVSRPHIFEALKVEMPIQLDGRNLRTASGLTALGKSALPHLSRHGGSLIASAAMAHPLAALVTGVVVAAGAALKGQLTYPDYAADLEDWVMALSYITYSTDQQVEGLNVRVAGGLHRFLTENLLVSFQERITALRTVATEEAEQQTISERLAIYVRGEAEAKQIAELLKSVRDAGIAARDRALQERSQSLAEEGKKVEDQVLRVETRYKAGLASQDDLDAARSAKRSHQMRNATESASIGFARRSVRDLTDSDSEKDLAHFYERICHPPSKPEESSDSSFGMPALIDIGILAAIFIVAYLANR
jgi:hypothetical protein